MGREVLFVGLGLGVLQRGLDPEGRGLTIERSDGVVELFGRLWPSSRINIQVGDFYELLPTINRAFDTVLIDHHDSEFRSVDPINLKLMLSRLRPLGQIVINRQGQREEFIEERGIVQRPWACSFETPCCPTSRPSSRSAHADSDCASHLIILRVVMGHSAAGTGGRGREDEQVQGSISPTSRSSGRPSG